MGVVSHYDVQPVIDIFGSVQGRDLGGVARDIAPIIERSSKDLPRGSQLVVRGQIQTMNASFVGLLCGPRVLDRSGLSADRREFSILARSFHHSDGAARRACRNRLVSVRDAHHDQRACFTGAIMCMGVATANSILVSAFRKKGLEEGKTPAEAALEAGFTRFRPVLMTALAMIIGMLPMSLGLGEGGEQNAPLGRAVIGGLLFATVATLFFVPVFFSLVHSRGRKKCPNRS